MSNANFDWREFVYLLVSKISKLSIEIARGGGEADQPAVKWRHVAPGTEARVDRARHLGQRQPLLLLGGAAGHPVDFCAWFPRPGTPQLQIGPVRIAERRRARPCACFAAPVMPIPGSVLLVNGAAGGTGILMACQ